MNFSIENTPNEVKKKSKLLILDSIAAIIKGNQSSEIQLLIKSLSKNSQKPSNENLCIFGTKYSADFKTNALIQGISMVTDELDEGNPVAKGHPAAHYFPALLSYAINKQVSGKTLQEAFIVNYEISARLGKIISLNEDIHPHGNWGVFGNGFGLGKLLHWDNPSKYEEASMLSTSFSFPTLWKSVLEGHNVRNLIIGLNNYNTTLLSDFIQSGFTASISTASTIYNNVLSKSLSEFPTDFNEKHIMNEAYFKFYPYCRFCHSSIDVALKLLKDRKLEKVKSIVIKTYDAAAQLNGKNITTSFGGKFSIPYAISEVVYNTYKKTGNKQQFIKSFMDKIEVKSDKKFNDQFPDKRLTSLEITFNDGEIIVMETDRATGAMDETDLIDKVVNKNRALLNDVYSQNQTEEIIDTILNIDQIKNLSDLEKLFRIEI